MKKYYRVNYFLLLNDILLKFLQQNLTESVFQSTLNPDAAEFIPAFKPTGTAVSKPSEVGAELS